MATPPEPRDPPTALRRSVSLPWLVLYGLGTTIGAGIYALTGVVAGQAGMHAPFAFALASLLALFTALSFGELSSRFPRAGSEAVYVLEGFRSLVLSRVVGVLVVAAGLVSAATVCVGLTGYLSALVPLQGATTAALVVLAVGAVAAWGVRESVVLAGVMTLVEIGGLLLVTGTSAGALLELPAHFAEMVPRDLPAWSAVGTAAILCFYGFLGFEDMVSMAEEVHDARRALPRAIAATLAVTTLLYVLLTTVAVLAVAPDELARADAPLSMLYERAGGHGELLAGIAVVALANGGLVQLMKGARVLYGMAREGALPAGRVYVSARTRTPLVATAVVTGLAALFALVLPLEDLAKITSLITLCTFTLANGALLMVKRRGDGRGADEVRVPVWVPVIGFVASLGFVIFELSRALRGWLP